MAYSAPYYVPGSGTSQVTIEGVDELAKMLAEIGNLPQAVVTKAAKTGANMALNFALANLQPANQQGSDFLGRQGRYESHLSGTLKALLRLKMEKSAKGKTVYRIDTSWYAHLIDLGWTDRKGMRWDGHHFLRFALTNHYGEIKQAMIDELAIGVEKLVGT